MTIDTTNLDDGTDKVKPARAALKAMADTINSLLATTGASIVGQIAAGVGAVARTVGDWFSDQPSVMDFIPFTTRVAIRLRTSTEDVSAYVAAAYAASPSNYWPRGRYYCNDVDTRTIYGARFFGESANVNDGTQVYINADNVPGFRVWGPVLMENFFIKYVNPQTLAGGPNAYGVELNNIAYANFRNIRIEDAAIPMGIPQSAFGTTAYNVMFASVFSNVAAIGASNTYFDFRNFGGGGTNCTFTNMYLNGRAPLDGSAGGQIGEYGVRFSNCSGYEWGACSIDGVIFNQVLIDGQNFKGAFPTLRAESCRPLKNNGDWFLFGGGHAEVDFGYLEIYRPQVRSADGVNTTTILRSNAAEYSIRVGKARIAYPPGITPSAEFTTATKRFFRAGGSSEDASFYNDHFLDETALFTTPWADDTAATRTVPPIRRWNGKTISERVGTLLIGSNVGRIVYLPQSQAPFGASWAANLGAKPWIAGDRIVVLSPGDYGRVAAWVCIADGTPGTWVPFSFVGGEESCAFPGDVDWTFTPLLSRPLMYFATALTANRTITLDATGAWNGLKLRVTRPATGAFTLSVGGLKSLATGQWCEVVYDGTAYRLTAFGSL